MLFRAGQFGEEKGIKRMHLLSGQFTPSQSLSAPFQQQNRSHGEESVAAPAVSKRARYGAAAGRENKGREMQWQRV